MVGDVAAAAGLEDLDSPAARARRSDDVRAVVPGFDAERDDGRMLEQQELIGNLPAFRCSTSLLKVETVGVGDLRAGGLLGCSRSQSPT